MSISDEHLAELREQASDDGLMHQPIVTAEELRGLLARLDTALRERDEARRSVCERAAWGRPGHESETDFETPEDAAALYGWDLTGAPAPLVNPEPTCEVKILVAVNERGEYQAEGWGSDGEMGDETVIADNVTRSLDYAEQHTPNMLWATITASVPLPRKSETTIAAHSIKVDR